MQPEDFSTKHIQARVPAWLHAKAVERAGPIGLSKYVESLLTADAKQGETQPQHSPTGPHQAPTPEEQAWVDRLLRLFRTGHPEVVATLKNLMQTLEITSNGYSEREKRGRIRDTPSGGRGSGRAT